MASLVCFSQLSKPTKSRRARRTTIWAEEGSAAGAGDVVSSSPGYKHTKKNNNENALLFLVKLNLNNESFFKATYNRIFTGMKTLVEIKF